MEKRIDWPDGCYRIFNDNGTEKESKVIATKYISADSYKGPKHWYYVFRDENGKIIKEYYGEQI